MLGIVILNVVFSAAVIVGILALLGAGIWSDAKATSVSPRRRVRTARAHHQARPRGVPSRASQLTA